MTTCRYPRRIADDALFGLDDEPLVPHERASVWAVATISVERVLSTSTTGIRSTDWVLRSRIAFCTMPTGDERRPNAIQRTPSSTMPISTAPHVAGDGPALADRRRGVCSSPHAPPPVGGAVDTIRPAPHYDAYVGRFAIKKHRHVREHRREAADIAAARPALHEEYQCR